jgi:hypothetical protein
MKMLSRRACTMVAIACWAGPVFAACGGSPGGPSPSPPRVSPPASPAAPAAVPTPQITSGSPPAGAVAVVRQYWTLLSEREYDAAFALTTGSHIGNAGDQPKSIDSARYLHPVGNVMPAPGDDATLEFGSLVFIVPTPTGSPFGTQPRRWLMFSRVVRMSDGSWRLAELGTGP